MEHMLRFDPLKLEANLATGEKMTKYNKSQRSMPNNNQSKSLSSR